MSETTYTTKNGDTWDMISFRLTGSPEQVIPLMQANPKYTEEFIFPAGVVLTIPELNSVIDYDTLPPWKRV